jgi:hypothetical protein
VKKSKFYVEKFGNAVLYVGRTFNFIKKYAKKGAFDSEIFCVGKIVSVVFKKTDPKKLLHFKFYNHNTHPQITDSTEFGYALCASFMSSVEKVRMVEFESLNGTKKFLGSSLVGRRISKPFPRTSNFSNKVYYRFYSGIIKSYDEIMKLYKVDYPEDDDTEDLYEKELLQYLKP